MMEEKLNPMEEDAADYVLGFMTPRQRKRVERDPSRNSAAMEWHARLLPLANLAKPVNPPDEIWTAIRARLDGAKTREKRISFWYWIAPSSLALAGLAAIMFLLPARPVYRADIAAGMEKPAMVAEVDSAGDIVVKTLDAPPIPADKSLELWVIPAGGAPHPLGVMPRQGDYRVHLGIPVAGAVLAVSMEPYNGSPTGQPTGPVVATGKLVRL